MKKWFIIEFSSREYFENVLQLKSQNIFWRKCFTIEAPKKFHMFYNCDPILKFSPLFEATYDTYIC